MLGHLKVKWRENRLSANKILLYTVNVKSWRGKSFLHASLLDFAESM